MGGLQLNLHILCVQDLILELALSLEERSIGLRVLSLLLFIAFNPHVSRFFFALQNIRQRLDLLALLLLRDLKLSLNCAFFNL